MAVERGGQWNLYIAFGVKLSKIGWISLEISFESELTKNKLAIVSNHREKKKTDHKFQDDAAELLTNIFIELMHCCSSKIKLI